jgi:hypothetical protein
MSARRTLQGALLAPLVSSALAGPDIAPPLVARVEVVGTLPYASGAIDRNLLPYVVQQVDRNALQEAQSDNLAGFMARRLGGVNVNEVAGSPFQADVTYRGYRASPILGTAQGLSVYLDGVRVNEPFGDVVNWDMLPEAALGKLLLVPGSNPLYGLNTLGGALALQTRSGLDDAGLEGEVMGGMTGRRRAELSYGARNADGWHAFAAATLFDENGWREHSSGRLGNLFAKAGYAGPATQWSVALLGGASQLRGNGLLPSYRSEDGAVRAGLYEDDRGAAYTWPDRTENRLLQASFNLVHRLARGVQLTTTAYARASRRDANGGDVNDAYADYTQDCGAGFEPDGTATAPGDCPLSRQQGAALHPAVLNTTHTRQHGQGASLNLHMERGGHVFDAGASIDRSRSWFEQLEQEAWFTPQREVQADPGSEREPRSSVTGTAQAFGVYAAGNWALTRSSHLSASVRFNRARVASTLTTPGGPQAPESFTYTSLNPALGISQQTGPFTWFATVAQGNRVPTVIELGCADPSAPCRLPVGLQSDPYLRQVVARTTEAGARAQWGALEAELSLYRTVNRDDILFVGAAASRAGYFANFPRTVHQGAAFGLGLPVGSVRWRLDYSYLHATYGAQASLFMGARTVQVRPGTPIAGLPRHTFKLGVEWDAMPGLVLGADVQAVSALRAQGNEDGLVADPLEGEVPERADWSVGGHALLNLRASWRVAPGWELFARASNVMDRRYETYAAVATDMFPNGQLLQPHAGPVERAPARFVAPGAPRLLAAGLRYRF